MSDQLREELLEAADQLRSEIEYAERFEKPINYLVGEEPQ